MLERLPDRILTPAGARAITLPSAVLLGAAGASAIIVAGAPLAVAALAGLACWGARVALALPRGPRREVIDPFAVGDPWRTLVREAMEARARFDRAVRATKAGPLHDRLQEVGARISDAVREAWAIACRGDQLDDALRQLDIEATRRELAQVQRELGADGGGADLEATATALRHQLQSYERLQAVGRDARDRLRRIDAELDEAVARAVELSLRAADVSELSPLGSDVDALVGELESLRQALEETGGAAASPAS